MKNSKVRPETPFNATHGGVYKTRSGEIFDLLDTIFHDFINQERLAQLSVNVEAYFELNMDRIFRANVMALVEVLQNSVLCERIDQSVINSWFDQVALPRFRALVKKGTSQNRLRPASLSYQGKKITRQSLKVTALRCAAEFPAIGERHERVEVLERFLRQRVNDEAGPSRARQNAINHATDALRRYMEDRVREVFRRFKENFTGEKRTDLPKSLMKSFLDYVCQERFVSATAKLPTDAESLFSVIDSMICQLNQVLLQNREYARNPEESGRRMLNHLHETRLDFKLLRSLKVPRPDGPRFTNCVSKVCGNGDLRTTLTKGDSKREYFSDTDALFKPIVAVPSNQWKIAQLQTLLRERYGLEIVDVEGDNRCLFRVFEHSRTGNSSASAEIVDQRRRTLCRKFLSVFGAPEKRELFFESYGETVLQYAERMMRPEEWGDHLMIEMHAQYSQVCVVVWIPGRERPMIFGDETRPECHIVWGSLSYGDSRNHYMSTQQIGVNHPTEVVNTPGSSLRKQPRSGQQENPGDDFGPQSASKKQKSLNFN